MLTEMLFYLWKYLIEYYFDPDNLNIYTTYVCSNEACMFQSFIYDYIKLIANSNNPDYTWNSLSRESNHLSRRQLKKVPKI